MHFFIRLQGYLFILVKSNTIDIVVLFKKESLFEDSFERSGLEAKIIEFPCGFTPTGYNFAIQLQYSGLNSGLHDCIIVLIARKHF